MKHSKTTGLALLGAGLLGLNAGAADWYAPVWPHRVKLTIPAARVSADLVDFPVLVSLERADLKSAAHGGHVGSDTAADLLFTASDGTTRLSHEIEDYDPATGRLTAWVRIPHLPATADTSLYLYYGQPGATDLLIAANVWDADYLAVHHFADDPSGDEPQMRDATAYQRHATAYANMTSSQSVQAQIGRGLAFDGINDYVACNGVTAPRTWSTEMWVNLNKLDYQHGLLRRDVTGFRQGIHEGDNTPYIVVNTSNAVYVTYRSWLSPDLSSQRWHHVAWTYDASSNLTLYVNGSPDTVWTDIPIVHGGSGNYTFGMPLHSGLNPPDVLMDEVRVSATARSADWIGVGYTNQVDPAAFCQTGDEETVDDPTPWSGAWGCRVPLAIPANRVAGNLANFPVLVQLQRDGLRDTAHGGGVAQTAGADIRFTAADGVTRLAHEIERYDPAGGALTAWVNVGTLETNVAWAARFYLYYGHATCPDQADAAGVWNADYLAVHHLADDPSGAAPQMRDATVNARHGTTAGSMTADDLVAAKIGHGLAFDGTDDAISCSSVSAPRTWTTELWIWLNDDALLYGLIGRNSVDFRQYVGLTRVPSIRVRTLASPATYATYSATASAPVQAWNHIAWTYDAASNLCAYVNGTPRGTWAGVPITHGGAGNYYFSGGSGYKLISGFLDEVRISASARSADWVVTSYINQNDPATFCLAGREQVFVPHGSVILVR